MSIKPYRPNKLNSEGRAYIALQERCRKLEATIAYLRINNNQLRRGEFICKRCSLRKNSGLSGKDVGSF